MTKLVETKASTTFVNVFKSIATSNQIAQVAKVMHSESLIETLRELHREELLAIRGIGPKLAEVLLEAGTEYRRLIAEYPIDIIDDIQDEEEEYLAPELDNALQVALMNIKPRKGQTFIMPEEAVETVPNSVPGGIEEAMAGLTKALRGCVKLDVWTRECVLMMEGNVYRVYQGPWSPNLCDATHVTDLQAVKGRVRAICNTAYKGTLFAYVVHCKNGVIIKRSPSAWWKYNCATLTTVDMTPKKPEFGPMDVPSYAR